MSIILQINKLFKLTDIFFNNNEWLLIYLPLLASKKI